MALRKEALRSGELDGLGARLADLLCFELVGPGPGDHAGRGHTTAALNYLAAFETLRPIVSGSGLSTVTLRQIHVQLYENLRGRDENPGTYRSSDIWIGPAGSSIADALFVPPPPHLIEEQMQLLDAFLADSADLPALVKAGLVYYQLETIYPYVDGNGRVARLATQLLLARERLVWPQFLSLSAVFGRDPSDHFQRLQQVRLEGDWEGWMAYFLRGVREAAEEGMAVLSAAVELRREHRALIERELGGTSGAALRLLDALVAQPLLAVANAAEIAKRTFANANQLISNLERMGLLVEITGRRRNRRYCYSPYLQLFGAD